MKKAINEAKDWLVRAEKHPVCTVNGWWRWVLPDPGDSDAMEELPEPVFKRLIGDPEIGTHTWLFMTRERAMVAGILAVDAAMRAGWCPKPIL
jgi:hypothetical protein